MASWSEPTRHIARAAADSQLQSEIRREDTSHVRAERAQKNHETVFLLGVAATMATVVAMGVHTVNFNRSHARSDAPDITQAQPPLPDALP